MYLALVLYVHSFNGAYRVLEGEKELFIYSLINSYLLPGVHANLLLMGLNLRVWIP